VVEWKRNIWGRESLFRFILAQISYSNKPPLQRRSKALTQMRTWISCRRSLLASWVLYAGSINMPYAVDSLNVETMVEGSRCATALASHAGIPEPLVLRFEECSGSLPPGGSLWRKEYQGGSGSGSEIDGSRGSLETPSLPSHEVLPRADPRSLASAPRALGPGFFTEAGGGSWALDSTPPDTHCGVLRPAGGSSLLRDLTLQEQQEAVEEEHSGEVSTVTVSRNICRLPGDSARSKTSGSSECAEEE
jgi:hypothetical protein